LTSASKQHESHRRGSKVPVIEVTGLTRSYTMGAYKVQALKAVDLTIHEGEFVAIVGASGSGKSTLMYLLGCLDTPDSGSYRVCGQEVSKLDDRQLSRLRNREIGFVFQQFYLLPELDVTANIALGLTYAGEDRARRRAAAQQMAEQMGLGDRLVHKATELSGGQMQRVAIARALASQPHILLADEPTGNLDSHTGGEIMALFKQLHTAGKTVVLVTHDDALARQADRVISISDGRIVSDEHIDHDSDDTEAVPQQVAVDAVSMPGLRFTDLLNMSLREGLLAHKLRTMLTMLGIIFGIAAVIAMTAITEGGKRQQLDQLRQIGLNNIQIRDLRLEAARLLRERRLNPRGVTLDDLQHIRGHVEGIAAASAWKHILAELRFGNTVVEDANVLGVHGDFQAVVNYHVAAGRFLDHLDEQRFSRVCVLGPEIVAELKLGEQPLGKVIIIGDQPFTVVGVMEPKAFAKSAIADVDIVNRNRDVYLPFEALRLYFRKDSTDSELDVISLRMDSDDQLVSKSELIRYVVSVLHTKANDFGIFVPLEKLKQAQQTKDVFNVIIIIIAGISLIVGGIGIMNIMLATVTERTSEIGIRRAVGASRGNVMRQFLIEALLIAFFGGLLGIIAGIAGGLLVEYVFEFPVGFSAMIIMLAAAVSMGVGVAFGIYPAWLAANKDPVEALRN
jgi:macrolide transport system ATP-binding/permease protein